MSTTFRSKSVADAAVDIRSGGSTVDDLAAQSRLEITRYEPRLKAWVDLTDLAAESDAREAAPGAGDRPLEGMSVGVKDIIDVAGLPTRCGSATADDRVRTEDADCVQRLRELGVVIQGKTVTTEYGYFAAGPTTNPFSAAHSPGGSSSGSAAAVGAGTIPFALGTQTAGSLTRPASFCGVAGLVLTHGSTSLKGVSGMSPSLDSLGFLARTVEDLDYIYRNFAGREEDPALEPENLTAFLWEGSGLLNLDPRMAELLRIVPQLLSRLGVSHQTLNWDDHIRSLVDDHKIVMGFEAAASLGKQLGERRRELSPQLQQLLDEGDRVSVDSYQEANIRRDTSRRALMRVLTDNAVIVGPASHGPAPRFEEGTGSPELSRPWQLLGLPVVTVPGARTSTGLPMGIQLIGREGSEPTLLRLGQALEPLLRKLPSFSDADARPTLKEMKW